MMGTRVAYQDEEQPLEGYLAASASANNLPGVLVAPTWLNVSDSICRRADRLAELGYAVFVADLLGAGVRPGPPQLPQEIVAPFLKDRLQFRQRLFAGLRAFPYPCRSRRSPRSADPHAAPPAWTECQPRAFTSPSPYLSWCRTQAMGCFSPSSLRPFGVRSMKL